MQNNQQITKNIKLGNVCDLSGVRGENERYIKFYKGEELPVQRVLKMEFIINAPAGDLVMTKLRKLD